MSLDWISILLIITIAQGTFLITALLLKRPFNRLANRLLLILLMVFLWMQLEFLAIRQNYAVGFPLFYWTRFGAWYVVGPLLWFYTKSYLANPPLQWKRKYWLHFLPFILFTLLIPTFWHTELITWRVPGYGMLTMFDAYNDELSWGQRVYSFLFIGQFIHAFCYSIGSLQYMRQLEQKWKEQFANLEHADKGWLQLLHGLILFFLIGVAIFIAYLFFAQFYRRQMDYFFVLPVSVFTYLFAFKAMLRPQQVLLPELKPIAEKYSKSSLSKEHSQRFLHHVLDYMEKEKPYLSPNLRLATLADQLQLSTHHLSQIINENLDSNFYDFVNQYRIKAAQQLIQEKSHYTLLQVAIEVGYNNKTSFNNAFKKHAGMSPSQFKKQKDSGKPT